jgi:DNA-directed RNA polymerase specialized sigma24 family protein
LLYAEGYTAAEIATMTHAPRATVLARIARGRADLLNLAAQAGMAPDDDEIRGGDADQELNRG